MRSAWQAVDVEFYRLYQVVVGILAIVVGIVLLLVYRPEFGGAPPLVVIGLLIFGSVLLIGTHRVRALLLARKLPNHEVIRLVATAPPVAHGAVIRALREKGLPFRDLFDTLVMDDVLITVSRVQYANAIVTAIRITALGRGEPLPLSALCARIDAKLADAGVA